MRYFFSLGRKNALCGKIGTGLLYLQLFFYLLFHVSKNEEILVYHSLGYMKLIQFAKKIKRFKLILEVEEIYADVIGNDKIREKEMKFFQSADGFLFPTKMLSEIINSTQKPEVIIHGTYQVEPQRKKVFQDGKIHIVYAGTLDARKGVLTAVETAKFLPDCYHVHILGFGNENEIEQLQSTIQNSSKENGATVTYDGFLSGEEYLQFIQSCDIGLSPQNPDATFNGTSFPSKILSYISNGLRVVSIRIPAIEQSEIGKELFYYDQQTPQAIANAIMRIPADTNYAGRDIIKQLSDKFQKEFIELLEDLEK